MRTSDWWRTECLSLMITRGSVLRPGRSWPVPVTRLSVRPQTESLGCVWPGNSHPTWYCSTSTFQTWQNGILRVEVADDGVGGADASHGSGLRGLEDRVSAVPAASVWKPSWEGDRK